MATAARRRLGHSLEYLGHVESDETVWLAARRRRSLIAEYPEGKASKNIERLGRRLLSLDGERERERPVTGPLRLEEEQTYYEVLETEPGVSDEEIRRAHRTVKDNYASGSMVIAGPLRRARAGRAARPHQRRARHAVRARSPAPLRPGACPRRTWRARCGRRRACRARRAVRRGAAAPARTSAPTTPDAVIDGSAEVTGAFLRKVREIRGLELGDISQRTKISERYLRALEEEQFGGDARRRLRARLRHRIRARAAPRPAARGRELPGALPREATQGRARRRPPPAR